MHVTIQAVADEAGVSPATVSRVFNDTAPVTPATREQVQAAAEKLGYVPNATARSLSVRQTHTIGVLLPYLTGGFFPAVIRGLDVTARQHDRFLLLSSSHNTPADTEQALRAMFGRIDGLILMIPKMPPSNLDPMLPAEVPVVLLNCTPEDHDFSVLSIDNRHGARLATQHLIDQGHERIGVITGEMENYDARERLAGYRAAIEEAGLPLREEWIAEGDFDRESGHTAMRHLLSTTPRPTAVFVSNDYMAMGAIQTAHQSGLSLPEDLAVVGFDDIPSAEHLTPSLSSVDARMFDLGERAIEMLLSLFEAEDDARRVEFLKPVLRVRASSAPSEKKRPK